MSIRRIHEVSDKCERTTIVCKLKLCYSFFFFYFFFNFIISDITGRCSQTTYLETFISIKFLRMSLLCVTLNHSVFDGPCCHVMSLIKQSLVPS